MRKTLAAVLCTAVIAGGGGFGLHALAAANQPKTFYWMVYSNPLPGREAGFEDWYMSQHIKDLMAMDQVVAAQFFRLTDTQSLDTPQPHKYMMIWEVRAPSAASFFSYMRLRPRTPPRPDAVPSPLDPAVASRSFEPLSRRVTRDQIKGKTPAQILKLARLPG